MECAGIGQALLNLRPISQPWLLEAIGTAEWTGAPLSEILEEAGISGQAGEILFTALDQGIQGDEAQYYQRSLSLQEAIGDPFQGYQMVQGYQYRQSEDDPGEPVTLIKVRGPMIPPGISDFLTRTSLLPAAPPGWKLPWVTLFPPLPGAAGLSNGMPGPAATSN